MKPSKKNIRKLQEKANDFTFIAEFIIRLCNSKKFTKDEILSSIKALSKSVKPEDLTDKNYQILKFVVAEKESALRCLEFETKEELFEKSNDFFDEKNCYLQFANEFCEYAENI